MDQKKGRQRRAIVVFPTSDPEETIDPLTELAIQKSAKRVYSATIKLLDSDAA
jgi:hypothetical protein